MATNIKIKAGFIEEQSTEAVVLMRYQDDTKLEESLFRLNQKINGRLRLYMRSGEFEGKQNQVSILHMTGEVKPRRIIFVGLGKRPSMSLDLLRQAMGTVSKSIRSLGLTSFTIMISDRSVASATLEETSQAVIEGCLLGLYQFLYYRRKDPTKIHTMRNITLLVEDVKKLPMVRIGAGRGEVISDAVNSVRDLCNHPSNVVTPTTLAAEAREISKLKGVRCTVLDKVKAKKLGMGAYLGVAKGSHEAPQFIVLEYFASTKRSKPIVLVGKAVTFDTGGISLKPADNMERMKADMTGGAIVLQSIRAAARLKLPINLVAIVPATENMPGGQATKPGDILTSLSGKTIEVLNTDAEGRLILADGLAYASRYKPAVVIDVATLTGAVFVALGKHAIGLLGNDDRLIERVKKLGDRVGERVWQLPLWDEYKEQVKSDVADVRNIGGRGGGTITAAAFLSHFVGDYPWVHLDIAGTDWGEAPRAYIPKGPTAIGARLVIELIRDLALKKI